MTVIKINANIHHQQQGVTAMTEFDIEDQSPAFQQNYINYENVMTLAKSDCDTILKVLADYFAALDYKTDGVRHNYLIEAITEYINCSDKISDAYEFLQENHGEPDPLHYTTEQGNIAWGFKSTHRTKFIQGIGEIIAPLPRLTQPNMIEEF